MKPDQQSQFNAILRKNIGSATRGVKCIKYCYNKIKDTDSVGDRKGMEQQNELMSKVNKLHKYLNNNNFWTFI